MTPALQEAEAERLRARKNNVTAKIKHNKLMVDQHTPNVGSFLTPSSTPKKKVRTKGTKIMTPAILVTLHPSSSSAISIVNDNDDDAKINNEGLSAAFTLMSLTVHIRVYIFNYLGQTQHELINLTLVSKEVYEDCKRPGIEWKIIPTIEISPTKGGSTRALLQQLCNHQLDNKTNKKIRRYTHMNVKDIHRFDRDFSGFAELRRDIRMDWILSLDVSSSRNFFACALSNRLPNVREIDISNTCTHVITYHFFRRRHLEKVTWNNINKYSIVNLDGCNMKSSDNLKEIIMDDSEFVYDQTVKDTISNLENYRNNFIFHFCSKSLERISIRNAKVCETRDEPTVVIPQNALIKFDRNVPPLRWFQSDLTQENMNMLQLERPDIELLN
jgi:hypothetical protein